MTLHRSAFRHAILASGLLALGSMPAQAQSGGAAAPTTPARPAAVQRVHECRAIADAAQRLACFDRQVAALETAETAREIRYVDREQVRRTRRGLFGLSLPSLGDLFGGSDDDDVRAGEEEGITQITAKITSLGNDNTGRRLYVLDNGQQWVQVDNAGGRSPREGQSIVIRRASLGGFIANVEGRTGVRVIRTR